MAAQSKLFNICYLRTKTQIEVIVIVYAVIERKIYRNVTSVNKNFYCISINLIERKLQNTNNLKRKEITKYN